MTDNADSRDSLDSSEGEAIAFEDSGRTESASLPPALEPYEPIAPVPRPVYPLREEDEHPLVSWARRWWRTQVPEAGQPGWYSPREVWGSTIDFVKQPTTWYLSVLFLLACTLLVAGCGKYWVSVIDDAYITFRFSQNLIDGHGLRYNPEGMRVEGFTNFTWMIMIAAALKMGIDAMFTAKMAGMICGFGTMLAAWRFSAALRGRDDVWNLAPAFFIAGNSHFQLWCMQGLETQMQTFCIMAAYHFFFMEMNDKRRWLVSPWFAILAAMTRFDSLFFLSPLAVWGLVQVLRPAVPLLRMMAWGAICASVFGLFFAWKVVYFSDLFPNTVYAKLGRDEVNIERGKAHLYQFYFNQAGWDRPQGSEPKATPLPPENPRYEQAKRERTRWVLAGAGHNNIGWMNLWAGSLILCLVMPRGRVIWLVLVPLAMSVYYVYHVGGDWMPGFRFFQVAIPFWGVAIAVAAGGVIDLASRAIKRGWARWLAMMPALGFLGAALVITLFEQFSVETVYVFGRDPIWIERRDEWLSGDGMRANYGKGFSPPLQEVSDYLMLNTQDNAWILMSDIGQPMWFSPHLNLIDVDGLTDKYLADAPSVRKDTFGGPEIRPQGEFLREIMKERGLTKLPDSESDGLRREARRRYFEQVWDRNVRYIMEQVKPEYLLCFEQHPNGNPDERGYVYPEAVKRAMDHPSFQENYEEVKEWRPMKTGGVWNHLWRRKGVATVVPPEVRLARVREAIRKNPRMSYLIPMLLREMSSTTTPVDAELRAQLLEAVKRFPSDEGLIRGVVMQSQTSGDDKLAEDVLSTAITANPNQPAMMRLLAESLERREEFEKAAEVYERAAQLLPPRDNSLYYHLSWFYENRLHDVDKAMAASKTATNRVPDDQRAWSDYATISERAGRWQTALEGFEKLLELKRGSDSSLSGKIAEISKRLETQKQAPGRTDQLTPGAQGS